MSRFVRLFSSETALPHFHECHSSVKWAPNIYTEFLNANSHQREPFMIPNAPSGLEYLSSSIEVQSMGTILLDGE